MLGKLGMVHTPSPLYVVEYAQSQAEEFSASFNLIFSEVASVGDRFNNI